MDEHAADGSTSEGEDAPAPKPERILAAAERLLATRGHASVTVGEIAHEAGVSRGLLHYYFASKEDILARLVRRNAETSLEATSDVLEAAGSTEELIGSLLGTFAGVLRERPSLYSLYYEAYVQGRVHPSVRDELTELYRGRRKALADVLEGAQQQGLVDLPLGAVTTATLVIALADGGALQFLIDPDLPIGDLPSGAATLFAWLFSADAS